MSGLFLGLPLVNRAVKVGRNQQVIDTVAHYVRELETTLYKRRRAMRRKQSAARMSFGLSKDWGLMFKGGAEPSTPSREAGGSMSERSMRRYVSTGTIRGQDSGSTSTDADLTPSHRPTTAPAPDNPRYRVMRRATAGAVLSMERERKSSSLDSPERVAVLRRSSHVQTPTLLLSPPSFDRSSESTADDPSPDDPTKNDPSPDDSVPAKPNPRHVSHTSQTVSFQLSDEGSDSSQPSPPATPMSPAGYDGDASDYDEAPPGRKEGTLGMSPSTTDSIPSKTVNLAVTVVVRIHSGFCRLYPTAVEIR